MTTIQVTLCEVFGKKYIIDNHVGSNNSNGNPCPVFGFNKIQQEGEYNAVNYSI